MARPVKTAAEKKAKGTLQPCREKPRFELPDSAVTVSIEPPKGIPEDAKNAWVAAVTCCPFPLSAIDTATLERWCRLWAQWRKVQKILEHEDLLIDTGDGKVAHPAFAMSEKLSKLLSQLEGALGFSPIPRTRLRIPEEKKPENEFEGF